MASGFVHPAIFPKPFGYRLLNCLQVVWRAPRNILRICSFPCRSLILVGYYRASPTLILRVRFASMIFKKMFGTLYCFCVNASSLRLQGSVGCRKLFFLSMAPRFFALRCHGPKFSTLRWQLFWSLARWNHLARITQSSRKVEDSFLANFFWLCLTNSSVSSLSWWGNIQSILCPLAIPFLYFWSFELGSLIVAMFKFVCEHWVLKNVVASWWPNLCGQRSVQPCCVFQRQTEVNEWSSQKTRFNSQDWRF